MTAMQSTWTVFILRVANQEIMYGGDMIGKATGVS